MNAQIRDIVVELEIAVPKEKVWNAMLNRMGEWWPKNCLALEGADRMQFEPWAGGRQWVSNEAGEQILWGNVISIVPGRTIDIAGYTMPQWGGPALWLWRMEVSEGEGVTLFRLSNSIVGNVGDAEGYKDGWSMIFAGLKSYCERMS